MVENSRKDPRAKVLSMTVRYKSATLDEFIEHHSHDVSRGGMYIKTPQPFPPGTLLKFEVKIGADQKVLQGVGRVVWRRQSDEATESHPAGMGVKFIKLDEESKSLIGQVVATRAGETSAYDEVAANSERPPGSVSEPPTPSAHSGSGNFFPPSDDNVSPPAPQDRTVMKQAAELLQEALREVTSVGDAEPTTGKPEPVPSLKPTRSATTTPAPGNAGAAAASGRIAGQVSSASKEGSNLTSTVPPADVAVPPQRSVDRAASRATERQTRTTAQVRPLSYSVGTGSLDSGTAHAETAKATPIAPVPAARKSSGGALRALVMLLIVAGVAGAVFVITRKAPTPPPLPQPEPSAAASAAELAPTASAEVVASGAPSASETANAIASAEPSSTASAAVSDKAAAAPAQPPTQAEPEAEPKPKPVARPKAAARKKPAASTDTAAGTSEQPSQPSEATPTKPAETETPKAPPDTPSGSDTPSGATKPVPKSETPAAPAQAPEQQ